MGDSVGAAVDDTVGAAVGDTVGAVVDDSVGSAVGDAVDAAVGDSSTEVCDFVGAAVDANQAEPPSCMAMRASRTMTPFCMPHCIAMAERECRKEILRRVGSSILGSVSQNGNGSY